LKVTLITYTPEPEKIIASAAKLCYSSSDIESLMNGLTTEKAEKFIEKLTDLGHQSPLEHCSFTFGIEGVSRSLSHQLVRHRIASYSQKSQRYVTEGQFEYVIPPEIENIPESKVLFIKAMEDDQQVYDKLVDILTKKHFKDLLAKGVDEKKARQTAGKRAIEDARFVLPNACETKIIMTMNIRTLLHFFEERCCTRAQWEIRRMANKMLDICKEIAPNIFTNAGASCVRGKCKEGKMSCGNLKGGR
jgi:thymidylate synthase (FAD)